jgi:hypothetical protein
MIIAQHDTRKGGSLSSDLRFNECCRGTVGQRRHDRPVAQAVRRGEVAAGGQEAFGDERLAVCRVGGTEATPGVRVSALKQVGPDQVTRAVTHVFASSG